MEINVQWKLRRDFLPKNTFKLSFLSSLRVMSKKMESKNLKSENMIPHFPIIREFSTNLRKCILVQLGPTINPNSDGNRLVYEMFSFRRNVHHTPFCSAALPLILDVSQS